MKNVAVTQQDRKAADAAWDQQDHKAYQGQPDLLDQPEQLALKARWDYKDLLDRWDQWDHGDLLALPARLAPGARWDYKDLLDQLAPKDLKVRPDPPDPPDLAVLLEQQARLARPDPPARQDLPAP